MRRWTYAELKQKVQNEWDLKEEIFVDDEEMLEYANEAIDEAEAEIHKLGREDHYFLATDTITLVNGTKEYSLPTDIYANKIKAAVYSSDNRIYTLKRMRRETMFEDAAHIDQYPNRDQLYSYIIVHESVTDGYQMKFYPTPYEDTTNITLWYIRNANRLTADDDICDIPEFASFITAFMGYKVLMKEGHPMFQGAAMQLEQQRKQMISTLSDMVVDSDNRIEMDFTHYTDSEYFWGDR
jgi:hypothetical protein